MAKVILLMSAGVAGGAQKPKGQEKGKCSVWGVTGTSSTVSSSTKLLQK